ncbi:hypothetical protein D3C84_1029790 [compost metagenome]
MQQALHAFGRGTGEGAGDVAEQFAFDQAFGNSGAVQRHERVITALAGLVQLTGEHFLAGTGFALDQHRQVAILDPHRQAQAVGQAWIDFQRGHRHPRT